MSPVLWFVVTIHCLCQDWLTDSSNILTICSVVIISRQRMTSEKYHVKWNNQGSSSHPCQNTHLMTLASSNSTKCRRCVWTIIHSANIYWAFLRLFRVTAYSKQLCLTLCGKKTHAVNSITNMRIIWWVTFKCTSIYFKSTDLGTFFPSSHGVRHLGNSGAGEQWAQALVFSLRGPTKVKELSPQNFPNEKLK